MSLYIGILASQGSGGALLDSYGGAAAAFSLRKLSSTYGGAAVRVRRSLDNTEQDIGFAGGQLDQAALQAFVGYENLFTYSEQFENAVWTKNQSTITTNAGTDPFGGNNADRWLSNVGSTSYYISQNSSTQITGQSYTISLYVKSNTGSDQLFRFFGSGGGSIVSQNLTATNSWQRFTFTFVATASLGHGLTAPTTLTSIDLLIFGAQINQGVTAQTYQQTVATANTANGFVTRWYTQDGNGENLLLQSQTFETSPWAPSGSTVSANAIAAPDGSLTAEKLNETTANSMHYVNQAFTGTSRYCTYSVYLKAAERSLAQLTIYRNGSPFEAFSVLVDLSTGATRKFDYSGGITTSYGALNAGNGWWRVWCSGDLINSGQHVVEIFTRTGTIDTPINSYVGVAGSGVYIWGAQVSASSWLQGYQATTTTAVSRRDASQATAASQPRIVNAGVIERENGKPAIRFDGVDDNLLNTNTIPTTTSLSVFATFRKISHVNNAGIFSLRPSLVSPNDKDWASSNGRAFSAGIIPNGYTFIAHYIFSGSDGFSDPIDIKSNIALGSLISTSVFETGGLASVYNNGSVLLTDTYNGTPTAPTGIIIGARYDSGINQFGNVSIPDLILYPTNLLPSRLAIESNVGSYYQTQWIGTQQALLDQFGGSAAAFSLRNLSSSYRGPLVRVRRSSDNAETDIGGTFGGDLDVNSLLAFTGGQNLVTNSEDFTQANWAKTGTTATANATIAPDGALTADKLAETAVTSQHAFGQIYTISTAGPHTISFYIKAAERSIVGIGFYLSSGAFDSIGITVDLSNGNYFTGSTGNSVIYTQSVINVGNGWWRVSISGNTTRTGSHVVQISTSTGTLASPVSTYLGVAGSGVYVWGAQLTTGILQPYIPTTTAAINGANAFVTKWYDQSGIGDNRLLQSQTFEVTPWLTFQSTVVSNAIVAPDGTLTADKLNENTANNQHYIYQTVTVPTRLNTFSVYLKAGERNLVQLNLYNSTSPFPQFTVIVDLSSGLTRKIDSGGGVTTSFGAQNVGDGWYRVWASGDTVAPAAGGVDIIIRTGTLDSPINSYVGTTGWGVYMWGAQVSDGLELLRYQPTTTAIAPKRDAIQTTAASQPRIVNAGSVESENGKPSVFYNGTSNSLRITSIPLQTNITLITAIKNMSAVNPFIVEHSASASVNDGFFFYGAAGSMWNFRRTVEHRAQGITAWSGLDYSIYDLSYDTVGSVNTNGILASNGTITGSTLPNTVVTTEFNIGSRAGSSLFSNMDMSEFVIYASPLGASLPSARSNLNTYYQIYWQGNGTALLDSYSGASAAYSLRNLSSAYTGPLIRVRRSNDNVERDIYGTFRGDLDLAALTSFVGANSGFVTTWYDQSGIGDNLILQSQTFENASWIKSASTVSANTITAPDGTITADLMYPTSNGTYRGIYQSLSFTSNTYTQSIYAKFAGKAFLVFVDFSGTNAAAYFNIQTGTIGNVLAGYTANIQSVGDGWYRCSITSTVSVSYFQIATVDANGNPNVTANGTDGLYIWGAQLSRGSQLLRYQPTTTAIAPVRNAVQATAASQPRIVNAGAVDTLGGKPSLIFDGTNDFMSFADLTAPQFTSFYPQKKDADNDRSAWFTTSNALGGSPYSPILFGTGGIYIGNGSSSFISNPYQNNNYILMSGYINATNQGFIQVNGNNLVMVPHAETAFSNVFNRINARTGLNQYSKCSVPEMILYAFDNSANISAINNSINNYYKIY